MFRPPVETITHGRASSAPARGRRGHHHLGAAATAGQRPATATSAVVGAGPSAAGDGMLAPSGRTAGGVACHAGQNWKSPAARADRSSFDLRGGGAKQLPSRSGSAPSGGKVSVAGSPTAAGRVGVGAREGGSSVGSGAGSAEISPKRRQTRTRSRSRSPVSSRFLDRSSSSGRFAALGGSGRETTAGNSAENLSAAEKESLPPWELGLRIGFDGAGGWWPAAQSAVEDGARLDIYTGSDLDGRWLSSLDSRLKATMRATRR